MSNWGPTGSKMGKDPQRKRVPRTFGKRKASAGVKPYLKIMSRRGG